MTRLLFPLLLLAGCAELPLETGTYGYCGRVGELSVYVQTGNAFTGCREALSVTREANTAALHLAGAMESPWEVAFTWHLIDVTGSLAETDATTHSIRVGERRPRNVLHELLHARLVETGEHRTDDHSAICAKGWDGAERAFGAQDTCRGL